MFGGKALRKGDADSRERDVESAGRKRIQKRLQAKKHLFMSRIVKEHGHEDVAGPRSFN